MTPDPEYRGREVAALVLKLTPLLFADLVESAPWRKAAVANLARAEREWQVFAFYAGVRGLVAAGGFNRETVAAIDALHQAAQERWRETLDGETAITAMRSLVAERYSEYGAIGQKGGKSGAATVTLRLGTTAARNMLGASVVPSDIAEMIGALHESLAEGVAQRLREAI